MFLKYPKTILYKIDVKFPDIFVEFSEAKKGAEEITNNYRLLGKS